MLAGRWHLLLLPLLLLVTLSSSSVNGHNITHILDGHPSFSTFNHYLTITHLASEINRRLTITVLAIDNAGMSALLAKHLTLPTLRNVLALHILSDFYGAKKLHQLSGGSALSASLFQATGAAPGTTGYVNITDHRAGKVSFAAEDADPSSPSYSSASFVKSLQEFPYNLSIVAISQPLSSPEAEAPAAAPAPVNLTSLLSKSGCKLFADLLSSTPSAESTFSDNLDGGLTVFCPVDAAVKSFAPKLKNLTAPDLLSLLLYHGDPVYNSMQMLKTSNGVVNTLATERKNFNYTVQDDGEKVSLETKVNTAKILKTIFDQDPVAVYSIDKVLQPPELFEAVEADAPAPAPAGHKKGKGGKKKKKGDGEAAADALSPAGPEEAPADVAADDSNGAVGGGVRWVVAVAAAVVATVAVIG